MTKPPIRCDIFLDGKRHAARSFHSCPRIGEGIGLRIDGTDVVVQVYRVVHLIPSRDAEFLGWQEVDIYTKH